MPLCEMAAVFAQKIGLRWVVEHAPRLVGRGAMRLAGVEFFANRAQLQHQRTLDEQLSTAAEIDAVVVIGRVLHETPPKNIRRIRRVVFPNPEAPSSMRYAASVGESRHFQRYIAEATKSLRANGTKVKWYPDMLHHSFMIGDGQNSNGWVQTEIVLPFSKPDRRPSWRVYKKKHEDFVLAMNETFENIWNASDDPDDSIIARLLGNE